jgi:hypothetical protein
MPLETYFPCFLSLFILVISRLKVVSKLHISPDSSVSIVTGYGLDDWCSNPGREKECSLPHNVHTGCGNHSPPNQSVPEASFPTGKAAGA